MMTVNTHCQICAAPIKITKTGKIWHHGTYWQRKYGWEDRHSCPGSNHPPFEVSRDLIPAEIAREEARVAELEAQIADLIANPPDTASMGYGEHSRPADFRWQNWPPRANFRRESLSEYHRFGPRRGELTEYGQWLRTYEYAVFVRRDMLLDDMKEALEYIGWHRDRYAAWPRHIPWPAVGSPVSR